MIAVSVILCTRDPNPNRLARTFAGLAVQNLPTSDWEFLLIDNGSIPAIIHATLPPAPINLRIIAEHVPGLTPARLRGITEARGDVLVFVDDDNVLASDYLATALAAFNASPTLAVAGGPVRSEFEEAPPEWTREFWPLLALHDHGDTPILARGGSGQPYPPHAPVGAGLCVRRTSAQLYADLVRSDDRRVALDRRAGTLTSGGDNDLIFTAYHAGGDVAYLPNLNLTHLIPNQRLTPRYLARLNRGIQRSWVRVLALHGQCPWPAINRFSLPLRIARAWWRTRAWMHPVGAIRFAGALGRFEGQADLSLS